MVCYDCWYAAGRINPREHKEPIECWNPKSEHFAKTVDVSFECPLFSNSSFPDPDAEKIILDPELPIMVRRKQK